MSSNEPIQGCMEKWRRHLRGDLPGGLEAVLHPDVVFLSPIVFTPQVGREITTLYLTAAGGTLGGGPEEDDRDDDIDVVGDGLPSAGAFGYTKTILQGHHAMLEFETSIDGKYVNGVDIITCDDDGLITEFKVMIRPLQAVNLVHARMKAMLERMSG